jgi:DNA polymerase-3 subunit epsilon
VNENIPAWLRNRLLVTLDTETTGLEPWNDRVVQIGATLFLNGQLLRKASALCNPYRPMPAAAGAVNGLTDAILRQAPPFSEAMHQVMNAVWEAARDVPLEIRDRTPLISAHNAPFDQRFLTVELARSNCWEPIIFRPWLCSMALAKAMNGATRYTKGFRLTDLCEKAGIAFNGDAHDAANDAEAAARLLYHVAALLPERLADVLDMQHEWQDANT